MSKTEQTRTYTRRESVVFSKTKEAFGGLSNMAAGFPIRVNGVRILTSEALYQACRFPHLPHIQRLIIAQISPMTAKMKSRQYRDDTRPDWDRARIKIMRWCLRVKLAQNWDTFSKLLLSTGESAIVEESHKDDFWGAKEIDGNTLVGMNVLGRLLMELREEVKRGNMKQLTRVEPPQLPDFLLYGKPIMIIEGSGHKDLTSIHQSRTSESDAELDRYSLEQISTFSHVEQPLLFDVASYEVAPPQREVRSRRFTPYPEYKDSGVPWLDKLPATWSISRGKGIFRVIDVRSATGDEELLTVSSSDGVVPRSQKTVTMFMAESYVGHKLCWPGDLVINSLWAWMQGLGFSRHHGLVSSAYSVYRPKAAYTEYWRFFHYLLRSAAYKWELQTRSKGVWLSRLQLSDAAFLDMPFVIPPVEDALAIVRYLDHANRRIDRFIRAKRKLIALLNEQKQVIIQQAVTRGLDPNVRLKPSGVEWLGDMPEHWEMRKLSHLAQILNGTTPSRMQMKYWREGTIPWLSSGKVNDYIVRTPSELVTELALKECSLSLIPRGSVIIGMIGQGKTRGTSALLEIDACINQNLAAIVPKQDLLDGQFLHSLLIAMYQPIRDLGRGANQEALNCEIVSSLRIPLPEMREQKAIVEYLKHALHSILITEQSTLREIGLIREYRTRLIADVVTGKIDVREAAQHVPAEAIEPEVLSEVEALIEEDEDTETEELETVAED
jgi:type I restriction enzyme, S subunit